MVVLMAMAAAMAAVAEAAAAAAVRSYSSDGEATVATTSGLGTSSEMGADGMEVDVSDGTAKEASDNVLELGADMTDVSLHFGLDDEEAVVARTVLVGPGGGDGCFSEGDASTAEVVLDAGIVAVSVAEGANDGLLAEEVAVDAGVSVQVGDAPEAFALGFVTGVPAPGKPALEAGTGGAFESLAASSGGQPAAQKCWRAVKRWAASAAAVLGASAAVTAAAGVPLGSTACPGPTPNHLLPSSLAGGTAIAAVSASQVAAAVQERGCELFGPSFGQWRLRRRRPAWCQLQ